MKQRTAESETRHGSFWVGLIFALLGGQILLLLGMVYIATSDPSFAVEPDYYQKGLNWDVTSRQLQQNKQLGWTIKLSVSRDSTLGGDRALTCVLQDKNGHAVDGAVVDLVAFPHLRGQQRLSTSLQELQPGEYSGTLRFIPAGTWEFRFVIRRGEDLFTHVVERNVLSTRRNQGLPGN